MILGGGCLGSAVLLLVAALTGPKSPPVLSWTHALDEQLGMVGAAVQARTETLAQIPRLAWAVATDEQTVLDLTSDELAFRPQAGESIEVGQLMSDGRVLRLLRLGVKDIARLPLAPTGRHMLVSGDRLVLVEVASVQPRTRVNELMGAVALSRPIDLAPLRAQLAAFGAAARLTVAGDSMSLGPALEGARPLAVRLSGAPEVQLTFLLPARGAASTILYVLAVLLMAASIAVGFAVRRRESDGPAAPLTALVPENRE